MINEEQINREWLEIKGAIRNLWGRIGDNELDEVRGNWEEISDLIAERSGETREEIKHKMDQLYASFDNDSDQSKVDTNQASFERSPVAPTAPRTAEKSQVQDMNQDVRTRSPERTHFVQKSFTADQGFNKDKDLDEGGKLRH